MPDGSNTVVDERGYRLPRGRSSGWPAIAQVLLKEPRVIILDEATSHPDSQPEAAIQNAMEAAPLGSTSLVVAYRLSTVIDADCILVRDQGRLVEQGRHEELLAAGRLYASLYATQFRPQNGGGPVTGAS